MDKRFRDRRRSVSRQRGRRRIGLVFTVVLLLLAVVLFLWLRSSDVFAVKKVTATVTEHVTKEDISHVTSEALGQSLLRLSTRALEEALLTLPYVRSAEVYRCFPDTLDIRLVEYEPVARLEAGDGVIWLVAEDGRALQRSFSSAVSTLPLLVPANPVSPVAGERVPGEIVGALPVAVLLGAEETGGTLPPAEEIGVLAAGVVVVRLQGGIELRLGDSTGLEQKLTVAADVIKQRLRDGKQVRYVDVSVPSRVAVKAK
jgi:cell division septal protein FtsQ